MNFTDTTIACFKVLFIKLLTMIKFNVHQSQDITCFDNPFFQFVFTWFIHLLWT